MSTRPEKLRVTEAARMLGVCSATLRDLDRSGIVRPKRTAAGHRFYSTDDLRTLAAVLHRHLPDGVLV